MPDSHLPLQLPSLPQRLEFILRFLSHLDPYIIANSDNNEYTGRGQGRGPLGMQRLRILKSLTVQFQSCLMRVPSALLAPSPSSFLLPSALLLLFLLKG